MSTFTDPRAAEIVGKEICTNGTSRIRERFPSFHEEWLPHREAILYRHARSIEDRAEPCNIITLARSLDDSGELDEVGGPAEILPHSESDEIVWSAVQSIQTLWQKREAARIGKELTQGTITAQQAQEALAQIKRHETTSDCDVFSIPSLIDYKPQDDPAALLGINGRWMRRGGAALLFGPPGAGKSSLRTNAAVTWALGKPWFGIEPRAGLKSLIIQAENDLGDESEMFMGAARQADVAPEQLSGKIVIAASSGQAGASFAALLDKLLQEHQPDLVWIDPLFSFAGDDLSLQKPASEFLRVMLDPIIKKNQVGAFLLHHSSKDPKLKTDRAAIDPSSQYFGSVELGAYPRAALGLRAMDDSTFELRATKRGKRAGLRDLDGNVVDAITLEHSTSGIGWEQIASPIEGESTTGKKDRLEEYVENRKRFCPQSFELTGPCAERIMAEMGIGLRMVRNYDNRFKAQWKLYKSFNLR